MTVTRRALARLSLPVLVLAAFAFATGCRVDHGDGKNDNVKVVTPFGGLSVRTDDQAVQGNVGLANYPGATVVQKDKDGGHDSGSADVNLSFGNFHLGVKAVSYRTPDDPAKVMAFYTKDMARYGVVLHCRDDRPVGTPAVTQDGLTCEKKKGNQNIDADFTAKDELRAGSKLHQHIVGIEREGTSTRFSLVALDLPGHLGIEDDNKDDKDDKD